METTAPTPVPPTEPILCRVTPWYYRRMGMLAGLCLVFGSFFLKDGLWGYPEAVAIAKKKEAFIHEFLPSFETAKKNGTMAEWIANAKAKDMPTGVDGDSPRWKSYAAQNGWEEEPKHFTDKEIAEQFYFAYGCFGAAVISLILILLNRGKVLRGEAAHWVTPEGVQIPYADVFRVDKRKWEHKGLAYAWYRVQGVEKRAVIDDLKYSGADRILERLLARFSGELIEKVSESASPESPAAEVEK